MASRRACAACAIALMAAGTTWAAPDSTFQLVAGAGDIDHYYATYLANGHWSLASSPLGTDAAAVQIAGLMDNTPADVSRPAAVPSFGEIDYFDGGSWLNSTTVRPASHGDYRQTLDMYRGTLTTEYVWQSGGRSSALEVTSLVSQADPHLGIVNLDLTPRQSGPIKLRFTLRWPPAPERLPLARMSAAQFEASVAGAHRDAALGGQRDVIWYPGVVAVSDRQVDERRAVLRLTGRAAAGQRVTLAVAVALPASLKEVSLVPINEPDAVGLELRAEATAGTRYRFTKFAVAGTDAWPLPGDGVRTVRALRADGYVAALKRHEEAWARLWESDIRVDGNVQLQRTLHSDLFYALENAAADAAIPAAACGFSAHYFGHVFWDNDVWVFPALLLLHPERARHLIEFRRQFLPQAMARAKAHGFAGAMYPWEADPASGEDVTPQFAAENADREVHVNSAVALAQWQYYLASGDTAWLEREGYPVIAAVADFWVSRVSRLATRDEIRNVTSPEEDYTHVDNEIYTNVSARQSLLAALAAARVLKKRSPAAWHEVADRLYQPLQPVGGRYLEFDAGVPHDKPKSWMASSVPMLAIPALNLDLHEVDLPGLFAHSALAVERVRDHANQMILVMMAILAADAGKVTYYADLLGARGTAQDPFLKPPFNVRSETPQNDSTYLLASSGGFLQAFIYGLSGIRLGEAGLEPRYEPTLPEGVGSLTLRGLRVRGMRGELTLRRGSGRVERVMSGLPALAQGAP